MQRTHHRFLSLIICSLLVVVAALRLAPRALAAEEADRPFLHPLFSDNMVVQRGRPIPVWGWTTPGATVKVTLHGKTATAVADAGGTWMARLAPQKAGGPYNLEVLGSRTLMLTNVMVGDVWICSGQSNMEMGIRNVNDAEREIAAANYAGIRLFTVPKKVAITPQVLAAGHWDVCTPETVAQAGWGGFTAAGYFFGRELNRDLNVPIGLIHTSWGGTIAEAWTSPEALQAMPDFRPALEKLAREGEAATKARGRDGALHDNPNVVTVLYNAMIAPLIPFAIEGAIWYQGESNAGRARQYQTLLPTMIRDWRSRFGVGDFPFLIVQLANYMATKPEPANSAWAELREAQLLTSQTLPNTGLALAIDIGDAKDIHPKNKQEVGRRLALAAESIAYHRKVEDSGPLYRSMKVEGSKIRLAFTHLGGGLVAKGGGPLQGFAIAGEDGKFVWADGAIDGKTVVVSSPNVPKPAAVRYAWADNPVCNLYNAAGLPAPPFRTDAGKH